MGRGTSLTGRTILIYGEQGLGDEIMFATCYGEAIDEAARAIFLCDARLERLFRRSFPQATVLGVPQGSEHSWRLPQGISFDVQCPAGSLPRFLRRSADAFPRQRQLLQPAAEKVDVWRQKFNQIGAGMKVGIAWRTGDAALMQSRRSTQLETWRPILTAANIQCVNLQYGGDYRREIAEVASQTGAKIFDPPEADNQFDLDGLAAKIAALDLVITVDNTIAHLAGAVGTPTWVRALGTGKLAVAHEVRRKRLVWECPFIPRRQIATVAGSFPTVARRTTQDDFPVGRRIEQRASRPTALVARARPGKNMSDRCPAHLTSC